jgi:hypothetical protein
MSASRLVAFAVGAVWLLSAGQGFAEDGPSFVLDESAWRATDVVVVSQAESPGAELTVLEVWKGNLHKGDTVAFPGLPVAPLASQDDIFGRQPSVAVSGKRIVLFLTPATASPAAQPTTTTSARAAWVGSNPFGGSENRFSAAWIEADQAHAFGQLMDGPSVLHSIRMNEAQLKAGTEAAIRAHDDLLKALAIKDPNERALTLKPLVTRCNWMERYEVVGGLRDCGRVALPIFREMLRDEEHFEDHWVWSMCAVAGTDAGAEMVAVLQAELAYWQKIGPALKVGWWNDGRGPYPKNVSMRLDRLHFTIGRLRILQYPPARESLFQLRDFWASLPQLSTGQANDWVIKECNIALEATPSPTTSAPGN